MSHLSEAEYDVYEWISSDLHMRHKRDWEDFRMLGYPTQIQGDMQIQCHEAIHELADDSLFSDVLPEAFDIEKWHLLLQIGHEDEPEGVSWGDNGYVFFWMREDDPKNKRFDCAWCGFQCG